MSILQIFDQTYPLVSGYSIRSFYITDSLTQLGVNVKVLRSPIFYYKNNAEVIRQVEYKRCDSKMWQFVKKFPVVKEAVVVNAIKNEIINSYAGKVNLIDAHSSVLNGMAAASAARHLKLPFLYEIRALWEDAAVDQGKTKEGSLRYNLTRKIETDVIRKADKITVICEGLRQDIAARGIDPKKIEVIPNGVNVDEFTPQSIDEPLKEELGLKDCAVIGFVGTFFTFEGLDLLVRAAKEIVAKRKNVKFLLVGGGRQEVLLKQLVAELNLQDHVIFAGRVKHDDVKRYYSVIDIFVYPRISLRITELVTPLKPLEAMALEKVVIGSDVGGLKELIEEGQNGLLFKKGNVSDLAYKCCYALDHLGQMQVMGKQSRQHVIKERNWLVICRKYLDIYKELGVKP